MNFKKNRIKLNFTWMLLLSVLAYACGGSGEAQTGQSEEGTENGVEVSENFKKFLVNFKPLKDSKTFGEDWLNEFNAFSDVKQVDAGFSRNFFFGNKVLNHSLGDQSDEQVEIPDDRKYYYVALSHEEEKYIGIIFTDNVPNKANTYFCTYTKEGKFISGMVIQAYLVIEKGGEELYFTREGGITFENKSMILVKEIVPGKGTQLTSYRLDTNGVISKG